MKWQSPSPEEIQLQRAYNEYLNERLKAMAPKINTDPSQWGTVYGNAGQRANPNPNPRDRTQSRYRKVCSIDDVTALHASEKALLCKFDDNRTAWVPFSQIEPTSSVHVPGSRGTLHVSDWWASQAGVGPYAAAPEGHQKAADDKRALVLVDAFQVYRRIIAKYHPDRNHEPYAQEVATDINELWRAVLKGAGKR